VPRSLDATGPELALFAHVDELELVAAREPLGDVIDRYLDDCLRAADSQAGGECLIGHFDRYEGEQAVV